MIIERLCKKFKLKFVILRFGTVYGERANKFNTVQNFIYDAKNNFKIYRETKGNEVRSYIHVKDVAKAHVLSLSNKKAGGRRLIVGSEVRSILELSKIMAKNIPSHAKKLPKRELPNFMVKLISYIDTSAKTMVPDLGLKMQTDQKYAEDILQIKFTASEIAVVDAAKSLIRLNLA